MRGALIICAVLAAMLVATYAALDMAYDMGTERGYNLGLVVGDFKASERCKPSALRPTPPQSRTWPLNLRGVVR